MSVKHGLLALLGERPRHGYQLKTIFEARTGGTWPLNIGQVYTTLQRLERDGLVASDEPAADGTVSYRLTDDGAAEVRDWWAQPVDRHPPARDELAIKLALAVGSPGVDARDLVEQQRIRTVRTLQWLTHARADAAAADAGRTTLLVLDRLIFDADAEVRWLTHLEESGLAATDGTTSTAPRTSTGTTTMHATPSGGTR